MNISFGSPFCYTSLFLTIKVYLSCTVPRSFPSFLLLDSYAYFLFNCSPSIIIVVSLGSHPQTVRVQRSSLSALSLSSPCQNPLWLSLFFTELHCFDLLHCSLLGSPISARLSTSVCRLFPSVFLRLSVCSSVTAAGYLTILYIFIKVSLIIHYVYIIRSDLIYVNIGILR